MKWRGYGVRTLLWSGDHCLKRGVGVAGSSGESVDTRVGRRGGSRSIGNEDVVRLEVGLPKRVREEEEGGPKDELEDGPRNTPLDESTELSQHEELQDLKLHRGKMVRPSLHGE